MKEIIVGVLALLGTLAGSYFSNRKANALIAYRLEQVEKKIDRLDYTERIAELEKKVAALEAILHAR